MIFINYNYLLLNTVTQLLFNTVNTKKQNNDWNRSNNRTSIRIYKVICKKQFNLITKDYIFIIKNTSTYGPEIYQMSADKINIYVQIYNSFQNRLELKISRILII